MQLSKTKVGEKPFYGIEHYNDFDYVKSLGIEVDNLRALLDADFKN